MLNPGPDINGMIDQKGDGLLDLKIGWNGTEYDGFKSLLMYNGGKNNDFPNTLPIGNSFIGYDCTTKKLCVAAYLNDEILFGPSFDCVVEPLISSSWVSIDENRNKLTSANADSFMYVKYPNGFIDRTIGE
jgi:hypothetical protein